VHSPPFGAGYSKLERVELRAKGYKIYSEVLLGTCWGKVGKTLWEYVGEHVWEPIDVILRWELGTFL